MRIYSPIKNIRRKESNLMFVVQYRILPEKRAPGPG